MGTFSDVSPLSDHNSRFEQSKHGLLPTTPVELIKNDQSSISVVENHMFIISPPQPTRSIVTDDDDNTNIPVYTQRKARPAPSTTWKAPNPIPKSSTVLKTNIESSLSLPELPPSTFPLFSYSFYKLFSFKSRSSNNFLSTSYTCTYSI